MIDRYSRFKVSCIILSQCLKFSFRNAISVVVANLTKQSGHQIEDDWDRL